MNVKIKKLEYNAIIPKYMTNGAVAFDIHSLRSICLWPDEQEIIYTGIAVDVPQGYELQIRQRSGLSIKYPNYIVIGVGTIDQDYRNEIMVPIINRSKNNWLITEGDRIAQAILSPIVIANFIEVEELSETERGINGFGSTGK